MMEEKVIVKRPPKSPGLAGVLAFFFPGVGALYNGQVGRFFLYVFTLASLITMLARDIGLDVFIALMLGAFYVFQIYDAAHSARLINLRAMNQEEDAGIDELEQIPAAVKADRGPLRVARPSASSAVSAGTPKTAATKR